MELCDENQLNGKRKMVRRRRTEREMEEEVKGSKNPEDEWKEEEVMTLYDSQEVVSE